ncbi:1-deoxy-D-xylulose-5-phosphate reductoisomerase [Alkaliphilus hydrothermalis]|uniref:1-deoxy-D-xylulose 5-phosphate reductoisomerase n=1 Tax=Alkaliphilus hydrothermalis TaxID=1482730 RepID=A0ABS2NLH7_9FIRM|nr:1-deoxy-D-xylulose-5-phosphate reductoisomerase [Alkaliphilus hydrothermalis]MBM7613697.1 1-deoxy-D-xylulose-5-phosphate reductoisomerase [Alkaliphilus hydrothermalis]
MEKNICILGSTGSIGKQALEVVAQHPEKFKILGLAAMRSIDDLETQIHQFQPKVVAVYDEEKALELRSRVQGRIKIVAGMEGLIEVATLEGAEMILNSVVGSVGVLPTLEAIKSNKQVALANKETLVVAGEYIMKEVKKHGIKMIPVDSEHSAIFQCLQGEEENSLSKIILTASGGPFRERRKEELVKVKSRDALKHPNWSMGRKISIDSATLMNKGLEVIEAKWLFDVDVDKIDVVVHPQSIIHSMIELEDASVIAQLGLPDMKLPIQYAFTFPRRFEGNLPKLDLKEIGQLTFYDVDNDKFPCLSLAYEALKIGGTMPCVVNGANEILVEYYLQDKIGFYDIPKYIEKAMTNHKAFTYQSIDEILEVDQWVRKWVTSQF